MKLRHILGFAFFVGGTALGVYLGNRWSFGPNPSGSSGGGTTS